MGLAGIISDLRRIERGGIDVKAFAGADDIGDDQSDDERQGREEEKVSKGLQCDAAHAA